ncbi:MAG: 16S rRNA (uracil(1498)-N(3))-methyltransferase [Lachnospiraceae bacterium]|nr:16S rRNA (uracil(1498)-N(3))-methyltransferase [Lachnospiraceae bacterium]
MYRFFTDEDHINGNDIYIDGSDYNHIKNVLRMKQGEEVSVVTGNDSREYRCEISSYEEDRVNLRLRFIKEESSELSGKIYLFQGLPKSDKLELVIQKTVELGVHEIIPVSMKRSVVKIDEKKRESKILRYNLISESAAKQAKRQVIPVVKDIMTFGDALEYAEDFDLKLLPYELHDNSEFNNTREILESAKECSKIAVFIGPEGGFSEEEVSLARDCGFREITLGKRILRTETAAMTIISWLMYILEG